VQLLGIVGQRRRILCTDFCTLRVRNRSLLDITGGPDLKVDDIVPSYLLCIVVVWQLSCSYLRAQQSSVLLKICLLYTASSDSVSIVYIIIWAMEKLLTKFFQELIWSVRS
jgi:hypothetical protein